MKISKLILLVLVPFFGLSQHTDSLDKNGFKNYRFGSSPMDYKNLVLDIDQGKTKLYSVSKAGLKIDNVTFEAINLTFWENKLTAISLEIKNSNGNPFLKKLIKHYGKPHKTDHAKKMLEWNIKNLHLIYEDSYSGTEAFVYYYHIP